MCGRNPGVLPNDGAAEFECGVRVAAQLRCARPGEVFFTCARATRPPTLRKYVIVAENATGREGWGKKVPSIQNAINVIPSVNNVENK